VYCVCIIQIGYDMGDYTNYYSHDLAFSGEEYNIVCESNIDIFNMGKTCLLLVYAQLF